MRSLFNLSRAIFFVAILSFVGLVYSLFSTSFSVSLEGKSAEQSLIITHTSPSFSISDFSNAGDRAAKTIQIENSGSIPVSYSLVFSLSNSTLPSALTLHIDGQSLGNLQVLSTRQLSQENTNPLSTRAFGQASINPLSTRALGQASISPLSTRALDFGQGAGEVDFLPEVSFIDEGIFSYSAGWVLKDGEAASHVIELEFYNGISEVFSSLEFDLAISVQAKSLDTSKVIFVSNKDQLSDCLTNEALKNRTIILSADIDLGDFIAKNMANIDLRGYSLLGNITFQSSDFGRFYIYSSTNSLNTQAVNITLDNENAVLFSDFEIGVTSFSHELFASTFYDHLLSNFTPFIRQELFLASAILPFYGYLIKKADGGEPIVKITTDSDVLEYADGIFSVNRMDYTRVVVISVQCGEASFELATKVLGKTEDMLRQVLERHVPHLVFYPAGSEFTPQALSGDIYLPTVLLDDTTFISWYSSKPDFLSNSGKITAQIFLSMELTLTAVVNINGEYFFHDYVISVSPHTSRLRAWFEQEYGAISFHSIGETVQLPHKVTLPSGSIIEVDYDLPVSFDTSGATINLADYFELDTINQLLTLKAQTDLGDVFLPFSFPLSSGNEVSGRLSISINLSTQFDIFELALDRLKALDFLPNPSTPLVKGFSIPAEILAIEGRQSLKVSLSFGEIFSGSESGYKNPVDFHKMAEASAQTLYLNPYNFPSENTLTYIIIRMSYGGEDRELIFPITLKGIIHYGEGGIADFSLYSSLLRTFSESLETEIKMGDTVVSETATLLTRDSIESNSDITYLDLSYRSISDLSGIEHFTFLTRLNLYGNKFSDISSLRWLTNLTDLWLGYTQIVDISQILYLSKLTYLDISGTQVFDASPIAHLKNLRSLHMQSAQSVKDYSFVASLSELRHLYCYSTDGASIQFEDNQYHFINAALRAKAKYSSYDFRIRSQAQQLTVTALEEQLWSVLSSIEPILSVHETIYLPFFIDFKGTNYSIEWSSSDPNILWIDNEAGEAIIAGPIANAGLRLKAVINHGGTRLARIFEIFAFSSLGDIYIEADGGQLIDAKTALPDSTLRYILFSLFDANYDRILTKAEQAEFDYNNAIDLSGAGLRSIEGIQYFTLIRYLNLSNNPLLTDYSSLYGLSSLETLAINGSPRLESIYLGISALSSLKTLIMKGSIGLESDEFREVFRRIQYLNQSLEIYTDSLTKRFDPFLDIAKDALSTVRGYYSLYHGESETVENREIIYSIDSVLTSLYLENERYEFKISYSYVSGLYKFNKAQQTIELAVYPSEDDYGNLAATLTFKDGQLSTYGERAIIVISRAEDILLKKEGEFHSLKSVAKAASLRSFILANFAVYSEGDRKYIDSTELSTVTSLALEFSAGGLGGLELFTGLQTLSINGYREVFLQPDLGEIIGQLTSLKSLTLTNSVVHLWKLRGTEVLQGLEELKLENCPFIDFYSDGYNVLSELYSLKRLEIYNNNITDFFFLQGFNDGHECSEILAYDNPASTLKISESSLGVAYAKLSPLYKGKTGENYNYNYKIASIALMFEPVHVGGFTVTYTSADGLKTAKEGITNANYITFGYAINLPPVTEKGYPLVWSTNQTLLIEISENVASFRQNSNDMFYKAYIVLRAYSVTDHSEKVYYFVASSTARFEPIVNTIDLDLFMENGEFCDAYFANYTLSMVASPDGYGIFRRGILTNSFNRITSIAITDYPNADKPKTIANGLKSIKGIEVFSESLTELRIENQGLTDIAPVASLVNLITLSFRQNSIRRLEDGAGNSYFSALTKLKSLSLEGNLAIQSYLPIVYNNVITKAPRSSVITTLDLSNGARGDDLIFSSQEDAYERLGEGRNEGDYYETIKAYYLELRSKSVSSINLFLFDTYYVQTRQELALYLCVYDALQSFKLTAVTASNYQTYTLPTTFTLSPTSVVPPYSSDIVAKIYKFDATFSDSNLYSGYEEPFLSITDGLLNLSELAKTQRLDYPLVMRFSQYKEVAGEPKNLRFGSQYRVMLPLNIAAGEAQFIELDSGAMERAEDIISDPILRASLFSYFDIGDNYAQNGVVVRDGVLSKIERDYAFSTELMDLERPSFRGMPIRNLSGLELFKNVKEWDFSGTQIADLNGLSALSGNTQLKLESMQFMDCYYLYDTSSVASLSGIMSLKTLNFSGCYQLSPEVFSDIYSLVFREGSLVKLWELNLTRTKIADYQGLLALVGKLSNVLTSYGNFPLKGCNIEYITEFMLQSDSSLNSVLFELDSASGEWINNTANIDYYYRFFASDTMNFSPFYRPNIYEDLPLSFTYAGTSYEVRYAKNEAATGYHITADGKQIFIEDESLASVEVDMYILGREGNYSYRETVTLILEEAEIKDGEDEITNGLVELSDGQVVEAATLIRDEMLRKVFFNKVDNGDGVITWSELGLVSSLIISDSRISIVDFSGLDLLWGLEHLDIRYFYATDLSPIYRITTLKTLKLYPFHDKKNPIMMHDLDGMAALTELVELDIYQFNFVDLTFLERLESLQTLKIYSYINNADALRMNGALFNRTSVAYMIVGSTSNSLNGVLSQPQAISEKEKLAAMILSSYDMSIFSGQMSLGSSVTLASEVFYLGKLYSVEFESLSPAIRIEGNELSIEDRDGRKSGALVLRIRFDGAVYEKFIKLNFS